MSSRSFLSVNQSLAKKITQKHPQITDNVITALKTLGFIGAIK